MAVVPTDLKFYQSLDTDSLGGGISTFVVPTGLNLFYDDVDLPEALSGSTAYRCFYVKNENATDTYTGAEIYISVRTPSLSTNCELGLGTSGLNGTEQSITAEEIAPVGVNFFTTSAAVPLSIGNLAAGDHYPIWIKRIVQPEAQGASNDYVVIALTGDGG
jgi:hypothetical protein